MALPCVTQGSMTMEEFKRWLLQFDSNGDGKISRRELREAIKASGGRYFSGLKSYWVVWTADSNGNGRIDEDEMDKLVGFARKQFGIRVV